MNNTYLRKGDFWSGLALAALGAYIVNEAHHWTYVGEEGPGPGFFPLWYGSAMVVLSLALVAGAVLHGGAAPVVRWSELRRALTCWLAFTACVAAMKWLGFVLGFGLLTWFVVAVMFHQPQRRALPLAAGAALGFQALFVWGLDLSLPAGTLF